MGWLKKYLVLGALMVAPVFVKGVVRSAGNADSLVEAGSAELLAVIDADAIGFWVITLSVFVLAFVVWDVVRWVARVIAGGMKRTKAALSGEDGMAS